MEEEGDRRGVVTDSRLSVRVSLGTYRLFYESGAEDVLVRVRGETVGEELARRASAREEVRRRCRWVRDQ